MTFIEKLQDRLIRFIPEDKIRVAAALTSSKGSKAVSAQLKREPKAFTVKTLADWKAAVATATDSGEPSFLLLSELYDNLKLDAHLNSVIGTRVYRVLRSKFKILNENGEENEDLKKLFDKPFFERFMEEALLSMFEGVKVIELFDLDENLELKCATSIPLAHINAKKGLILKSPGDSDGFSYRDGSLSRFYVQVGADDEIGMLTDLTPLIIAKKLAMGSWLDYIEKFGIPPVWITTDNMTTERRDELLDMGINMISNHVGVIRGSETVSIGDTPDTDTYMVFKELISTINSEISKLILGQDGTTDHKNSNGTFGSLKVLQGVANDRHESDKLFVQYIVNSLLFPKLQQLSSAYSGLAGHSLDWDESETMTNEVLLDKTVALTNAGFILDFESIALKTGIPITGFVPKGQPIEVAPADEKKKPPVKK
jgi:hypothetical protein